MILIALRSIVYEIVTSAQNALLKEIRRAAARGTLTRQGWCLAEGPRLLAEAQRSNCQIHRVVGTRATLQPFRDSLPCTELSESLFRSLSSIETPQGILALVEPPIHKESALFRAAPLILVLDGVQDPGNAGTLARAAEAFGATGVLFLKGAVNPWNPKTLRASAGSLFRLPMLIGLDSQKALELLHRNGVSVRATLPDTGRAPATLDWRGPVALVIGSEGQGLSEPFRAAEAVRIPTRAVESLNAAVAGAILLYEAARQRDGTFL